MSFTWALTVAEIVPVMDDDDIVFPITAPVIARPGPILAAPIGDGAKMVLTELPGDWSNAEFGLRVSDVEVTT